MPLGYSPDVQDRHDGGSLARRFGVELPREYERQRADLHPVRIPVGAVIVVAMTGPIATLTVDELAAPANSLPPTQNEAIAGLTLPPAYPCRRLAVRLAGVRGSAVRRGRS
jgi:hypothetical protein